GLEKATESMYNNTDMLHRAHVIFIKIDVYRVEKFISHKILCEKLRATCQVRYTKHVTVEEQVARFLHILARNVKIRSVSFFYHQSGETISRHFHAVLRAIILLGEKFLRQPSATIISPVILHNNIFYPYFM
ncbi:hypothetical protein S83_054739, partial [Arachis hypogaea]